MTVQCDAVDETLVYSEEEAKRRMTVLMRRLNLDTNMLLQLPPSDVNLLRYALDEQLRAVEEAEACQGAIALQRWKEQHPLPAGPSPSTVAARSQRPVGARSA